MKKVAEYYSVRARCTNCGYSGRVRILIGSRVETASCPTCGCQSLKLDSFPAAHKEAA